MEEGFIDNVQQVAAVEEDIKAKTVNGDSDDRGVGVMRRLQQRPNIVILWFLHVLLITASYYHYYIINKTKFIPKHIKIYALYIMSLIE